jgi:hypothetical protein
MGILPVLSVSGLTIRRLKDGGLSKSRQSSSEDRAWTQNHCLTVKRSL